MNTVKSHKLLIYIDYIILINKEKYKKLRIVIPVVVGSSPISHPNNLKPAVIGQQAFFMHRN